MSICPNHTKRGLAEGRLALGGDLSFLMTGARERANLLHGLEL